MMIGIDIDQFPGFKDDIEFIKQLIIEEFVFCLPGTVSPRSIAHSSFIIFFFFCVKMFLNQQPL